MKLTRDFAQKAVDLLQQGEFSQFFEQYVDDNVQWRITGTNLLSGLYTNKADFLEKALGRLSKIMQPGWTLEIKHLFVDNDTLIIEMLGHATSLNGLDYNNEYCWILQFEQGKIVTARVYYDDVLVDQVLTTNKG